MTQPTPDDPILADWLRLALTTGIGPLRGAALLARFGTPGAALAAAPAALAACLGSRELARALHGPDPAREAAVAATLQWQRSRPSAHLLTLADPAYPARLRHLTDAPLVIYLDGDPGQLDARQVAIVGSRQASATGRDTARALALSLARLGVGVTSGLAGGIDAAAHQGALAGGGPTIAVLGTGVDLVYPASQRALAAALRTQGLLLSELPLGLPPRPAHFPRRNRLIAALAEVVLVVEAAPRSGSLITARCAAELGRDVLAVPGSIHSPLSRGCHQLLRDGAGLVETVDDILAALQPGRIDSFRAAPKSNPSDHDASATGPQEQSEHLLIKEKARPGVTAGNGPSTDPLLRLAGGGPVHVDRLAAYLEQPIATVLARVTTLELSGLLRRLDDGRVEATARH